MIEFLAPFVKKAHMFYSEPLDANFDSLAVKGLSMGCYGLVKFLKSLFGVEVGFPSVVFSIELVHSFFIYV